MIDRRKLPPLSVTRVLRILEELAASARPLGLAELARRLDMPKSSLAALLRGLAEDEYALVEDGFWRLGPGAFGLGFALLEARRRFQLPDLVRDGMRRLAKRSGETVLFGVRDQDGGTMTYVDVIESRNAVRFAVGIGDRRALFATAGGRALLASASERDLQIYLEGLHPEAFTSQTETSKARLAEVIALAREQGVAQTVGQSADGVTGTASVIRDISGAVIGALIVAAPSSRLADQLRDLARIVQEEAAAISRSLGWYPATATRR